MSEYRISPDKYIELVERVAELEAERDRLREALEQTDRNAILPDRVREWIRDALAATGEQG